MNSLLLQIIDWDPDRVSGPGINSLSRAQPRPEDSLARAVPWSHRGARQPVSSIALCLWGLRPLFAEGRASCSLGCLENPLRLNLEFFFFFFTSLLSRAPVPVSIPYHPANLDENGFQGESGFQVTSPANNSCPSGRDPEISWKRLVWKMRGLVANPNNAGQSKYCGQNFCEQGLSKTPFAKMAHIFAREDLGTSSRNK